MKYYPTEDLNLNIARGLVKGTDFLHKFGAVPALSQNTTGTVWDINDLIYPWAAWDTPGTITADRAATEDADKDVVVIGLDADYNPAQETITLTNATGNAGTQVFSRVFRAYLTNGSANNIGNISIKKGATTVARISVGLSQTLMAIYTVPAGYTLYMQHGVCTAQSSADGTGNMFVRYFGNDAFRVGHSFEVTGGSQYNYKFHVPIPIPEKSDIDVRLTTRSNNGRYTAAFDAVLIKNGLS